MMYLVEKNFIDKETKRRYSKDMVYITEDETRALELKDAGFLGAELAEVEKLKFDLNLSSDDIIVEDLTVTQLKELLDQMDIEYDSKAKRDELISLIKTGD